MMSRFNGFKNWLDQRTGWPTTGRRLLDAPIKGPGWTRTLEPLFLYLVVVGMLTGIALSFWYSPSTTDAWASVFYIEHVVPMGSLVRGIHSWSMHGLVVVGGLILALKFFLGEYKKPRELNWHVAVVIMLVVVGFSITGLLLVYDQEGLAASKVETEIMRSIPVIGPVQRRLLIGGEQYGNLSLTRFFAVHAFILPVILIALMLVYIKLTRKHGYVRRFWQSRKDYERSTVPWFPRQATRDLTVFFVASIALVVLASMYTARLMVPADPAGSFDARPEWFFLPLYKLRHYFPGETEIIATAVLPGLALLFLFVVPFLDRGDQLRPTRRLKFVTPFALGAAAVLALLVMGALDDINNEDHQKNLASSEQEAERAIELASMGGVPVRPANLIHNDPVAWGEQLFGEHCGSCHSLGTGTGSAPDLAGWGSRAWIADFLTNPNQQHLFGRTELACKMDSVEEYGVEEKEDFAALVNGLVANRGESAPHDLPKNAREKMLPVFEDNGCQACHHFKSGETELGSIDGVGPDLTQWGSPDWFDTLLLFPDHPGQYGALNEMPTFAAKLDRDERDALRAFVFSLAGQDTVPAEKRVAKDVCGADAVSEDEGDSEDTAAATVTASWEQGKAIFTAECASCHVVAGEGTQKGPELTGWGSQSWVLAFLANPDHEQMYGNTDLEEEMPSATDLGLEYREDAELLARAFLIHRDGKSPSLEAAIEEEVAEVFDDNSCTSCHQLTIGETTLGEVGSAPVLTGYGSEEWLHGLLQDPAAEHYYGDYNAMPPFDSLSDEELASLTIYMMSLADLPLSEDLQAAVDEYGE